MEADAEYAHVLEIDMSEIKEPILCAPNDPDDADKLLDKFKGKLPTVAEYLKYAQELNATAADTYRYLNFDELDSYVQKADMVIVKQAI